MSDELYQSRLAELDSRIANSLPATWPDKPVRINGMSTLRVLRERCSDLNPQTLAIGWGDGEALKHIARDSLNRTKKVHWVILPTEMESFAHFLGSEDYQLINQIKMCTLHFAYDLDTMRSIIPSIFGNHESITALAGTTVLDNHPLTKESEAIRSDWISEIHRLLIERFDCLGNDVYDTFLGLKHTLAHKENVYTYPRSSDYSNHFKGKTAISIGAGPSAKPYLDHIREIQDEVVILCADSFLAGCLRAGIQPDFVCMLERPENKHTILENWASDTTAKFWCLPVVHKKSTDLFQENVIYWFAPDELYPWIDSSEPPWPVGRSTGTMSVAGAVKLGCKKVYLIGHDLAYGEDGASYAVGVDEAAEASDKSVYTEAKKRENNPNYHARTVQLEKNGGGTCSSRGVWALFKSDIEGYTRTWPNVEFINPNIGTGVGAVIHGTVDGNLPNRTGSPIDKTPPTIRDRSDQLQEYLKKCQVLHEDWTHVIEECKETLAELSQLKPLSTTLSEASKLAKKLDLGAMVSQENAGIFRYVFRAALRNIMVRLQQNLFVGTPAEQAWNQILSLRMYAKSIIDLATEMLPELEASLEFCNVEP